jgi:hypothetical protein
MWLLGLGRYGLRSVADNLFIDLSSSFSFPSESQPYSRSCVGRRLGAKNGPKHGQQRLRTECLDHLFGADE